MQLAGFRHSLSSITNTELAVNIGRMPFDGASGNEQSVSDFLAGETLSLEGEEFDLTIGQGFDERL